MTNHQQDKTVQPQASIDLPTFIETRMIKIELTIKIVAK
jgi:hypothetical protein